MLGVGADELVGGEEAQFHRKKQQHAKRQREINRQEQQVGVFVIHALQDENLVQRRERKGHEQGCKTGVGPLVFPFSEHKGRCHRYIQENANGQYHEGNGAECAEENFHLCAKIGFRDDEHLPDGRQDEL